MFSLSSSCSLISRSCTRTLLRSGSTTLPRRYASSAAASAPSLSPSSPASDASSPPVAKWTHPPSSVPAGTPMPEVVIFKDQKVPVALEDGEYPPWLWKLIGEGKALVDAGQEPAERGEDWDKNAGRREVRKSNKESIKTRNVLGK